MKQPDTTDLHIHSSQRTAVAHSGPFKHTRFVRVGSTHWMRAGTASPAEQEAAARHAESLGLPDALVELFRQVSA